ncbi:hypothetical protein EBR16_05920 [bacterium]|nr:hypothetical protein [bacterium]
MSPRFTSGASQGSTFGVKTTTRSLRALKGVRPIVCLTAYDTVTARIAEEGGADLLLVGDSVGNTVLGLPDTVGVTMDMMIHHTAAVARARPAAVWWIIMSIPAARTHARGPGPPAGRRRRGRRGGRFRPGRGMRG